MVIVLCQDYSRFWAAAALQIAMHMVDRQGAPADSLIIIAGNGKPDTNLTQVVLEGYSGPRISDQAIS